MVVGMTITNWLYLLFFFFFYFFYVSHFSTPDNSVHRLKTLLQSTEAAVSLLLFSVVQRKRLVWIKEREQL